MSFFSLRVVETATGRVVDSLKDSFRYDHASRTGTWQLAEAIPTGAFTLEVIEGFQNPLLENPPERERAFFPFGVLHGDINSDRQFNLEDVDALHQSIGQQSIATLGGREVVDAAMVEQLVTELTQSRPGDADLDGDVDFADFLQLATWFQLGSTWSQGDFNFDGNVTFDDFLILSTHFGFVRGE